MIWSTAITVFSEGKGLWVICDPMVTQLKIHVYVFRAKFSITLLQTDLGLALISSVIINLELYLRNVVTGYAIRGKVGGAEMGEEKKPC